MHFRLRSCSIFIIKIKINKSKRECPGSFVVQPQIANANTLMAVVFISILVAC